MNPRIVFLGIGSNSFADLNTASFAVGHDNDWVLVDCGPDIPRQAIRAGISHLSISTVVVTHRHLDHCLGLPYLLFGRHLEQLAASRANQSMVPAPLRIVCEPNLWSQLWSLFAFAHPDVPELSYPVSTVDIDMLLSESIQTGPFALRSIRVVHSVPTYGLIFSSAARKILAYSSDTLPSEEFISAAQGARVLIHEGMVSEADRAFSSATRHSTASDAGQVTGRLKPEVALMMHVRPNLWKHRKSLEDEASRTAGMAVTFPDEGQVIEIAL